MGDFLKQAPDIFTLFDKQWALVTAGTPAHFNACTLSWGMMGSIWGPRSGGRRAVTVYVHPARCTSEFLLHSDTFTLSFFDEAHRPALTYLGTHSGRDGDKITPAGLTPIPMGQSVAYRQAQLTLLCKKLCQQQFGKENLAPEIRDYYASKPQIYPDFEGGWQPHLMFIGEIIDVADRR